MDDLTSIGLEIEEESWVIKKNFGLLASLSAFLFTLSLFLISAFYIYIIDQSTNIVAILLPLVFLVLTFYLGKFVFHSLSDYPEELDFRLTQEGINCKFLARNEEKFLSWSQIDQYDQVGQAADVLFFGHPERIRLRAGSLEDSLDVVAFEPQMNLLRAMLSQNQVSFGYLRN